MKTGFWRQGEPFVWATGMALALVLSLTVMLLYVVLANGLGVFWPKPVTLYELTDGSLVMGEIHDREHPPGRDDWRYQIKTGNRDLDGLDFRWLTDEQIKSASQPAEAMVLERLEHGNFYGFLRDIRLPADSHSDISLAAGLELTAPLHQEMARLGKLMASRNNEIERARLKLAKLRHQGQGDTPKAAILEGRKDQLKAEFEILVEQLNRQRQELEGYRALLVTADGREKEVALAEIVRWYQPNTMSFPAKSGYYLTRLKELFLAEPRESNTEGGLFPAIFGTVMLTVLMSVFAFPVGVVAGIYLREYARQGMLVKMVRIAVNNLAGIPSIVYGIFGLGFFVYGIGASIDQIFFPERLPTPTFGTGGILWASLTLALLTVPVVIVATEEALGSIPPGIREGSQALAATKFQTLTNLLLPMASPGILTGFILAMARAAGEVAPLMITGVVKLAPALPLDGSFPYLHLDRKFMHLGFHIYDIGFQSPNVEAAKPMVYITTLLLILLVLLLTSTAIYLRNRMRKRYAVMDI